MALLKINWNPTRRELRQFALLWIGFFGLLGAYVFWRSGSNSSAIPLWVVAVVGLLGVIWPSLARPVYSTWMFLAMPIGWTISHLVLLAVFYLLITPIALVMRLCGYDPMARQFDRSANSYWTPRDTQVDSARYFKQY